METKVELFVTDAALLIHVAAASRKLGSSRLSNRKPQDLAEREALSLLVVISFVYEKGTVGTVSNSSPKLFAHSLTVRLLCLTDDSKPVHPVCVTGATVPRCAQTRRVTHRPTCRLPA
jgi:hypothetical protein